MISYSKHWISPTAATSVVLGCLCRKRQQILKFDKSGILFFSILLRTFLFFTSFLLPSFSGELSLSESSCPGIPCLKNCPNYSLSRGSILICLLICPLTCSKGNGRVGERTPHNECPSLSMAQQWQGGLVNCAL